MAEWSIRCQHYSSYFLLKLHIFRSIIITFCGGICSHVVYANAGGSCLEQRVVATIIRCQEWPPCFTDSGVSVDHSYQHHTVRISLYISWCVHQLSSRAQVTWHVSHVARHHDQDDLDNQDDQEDLSPQTGGQGILHTSAHLWEAIKFHLNYISVFTGGT